MSRAEERLGEREVTQSNLPTPIANDVPAKRAGNLVFTAGQISALEGREYKGKLSATLSIEDGRCYQSLCYQLFGGYQECARGELVAVRFTPNT